MYEYISPGYEYRMYKRRHLKEILKIKLTNRNKDKYKHSNKIFTTRIKN